MTFYSTTNKSHTRTHKNTITNQVSVSVSVYNTSIDNDAEEHSEPEHLQTKSKYIPETTVNNTVNVDIANLNAKSSQSKHIVASPLHHNHVHCAQNDDGILHTINLEWFYARLY